MQAHSSRRDLLGAAGAVLAMAAVAPVSAAEPSATDRSAGDRFGFCLNTSTISGANLTIVEQIDVASKAGYGAIEPWVRDIDEYAKKGGSLKDLAKRIADAGLAVPDAIAFSPWIIDDDAQRAKGLEAMKRDMETVAQIGGRRIAAPPVGATDIANLDLRKAAERYRDLLELGQEAGVQPLLELWGFSKALSRLGEVAYVTIESGRPDASMLLDIYHLHKGGSGFTGLRQINGAALHIIHMNDFPASPDREHITDAHRVYPGDGVAPLRQILQDLRDSQFRGFLSLELFNREYWKQSPMKVAKTGLEKMREVVRSSLT